MSINKDDSELFIDRFSKYIREVESILLERWLKSSKISEHDPFYTEVVKNVNKTIGIIIDYIETRNVEPIIELTKKIAKERIEANINISDYVFNINVGRSIVNELVMESSLHKDEKLQAMILINQLFDDYVFHAISEYTNLKDSIIVNKNRFIKEMHNDRLTIVGQIAASFAHEFRNPLTSIKGFIKMLEEKYGDHPDSSFYFDIINLEMESLEDKVSRFLYLSKSKGLDDEMEVFDFSRVANQMIEFMYPRFVDENIEVITTIEPNCFIFAVKEQIKQVLLNILSNAVEELSEQSVSRTIEIVIEGHDNVVECNISNNGKSIPAYIIDSIFEPFITTKRLGTGLGLSVVRQIIEKHEGTISVESNEDKTTFIIKWNSAV